MLLTSVPVRLLVARFVVEFQVAFVKYCRACG